MPRRDRDVKINKRMKEIVNGEVLKNYLVSRTQSYDDFLTLRRTLSYQYGVLQCLNYALSVPTELGKFMLDLRTGAVSVYALSFNYNPEKLSPFAIRFSKNFLELFGRTYINSGVLPAFLATADALTNSKYLLLTQTQLPRLPHASLRRAGQAAGSLQVRPLLAAGGPQRGLRTRGEADAACLAGRSQQLGALWPQILVLMMRYEYDFTSCSCRAGAAPRSPERWTACGWSRRSAWQGEYDVVGLLGLGDGLLELHQLPLLLPDVGHALVDLPAQLRHARLDGVEVIAVDAELVVDLVALDLEAFDVWVAGGGLALSFWKMGWAAEKSLLIV